MTSQGERRLWYLISWTATLIFLWAATYVFKVGLGWFAVLPILLMLYVNPVTSTAIKRVLVAICGTPFLNASKYFLFILFGFGSALYMARFAQSFSSFTEFTYILWALALATTGVLRLLEQLEFVHFSRLASNEEETAG